MQPSVTANLKGSRKGVALVNLSFSNQLMSCLCSAAPAIATCSHLCQSICDSSGGFKNLLNHSLLVQNLSTSGTP
eukprot:766702-Hanusia_phi.AAC.1